MNYKKVKALPYQDLTDWFIKIGLDLASYEVIGKKIKSIRTEHEVEDWNSPIMQKHLPSWIALCRADMEIRYRKTLFCVTGCGYKVASPRELAIYTARFLRRTLTHADRTMRLADIVDRKRMPSAIREVFYDQMGKGKRFRSQGTKFMLEFSGFLKEEKQKELGVETNGKKVKVK